MRDLDPATGLPKLPDNQRWNVVAERVQIPGYQYAAFGNLTPMYAPTGSLIVYLERQSERSWTPAKKHWWNRSPEAVPVIDWHTIEGSEPVTLKGNNPVALMNACNRILNQVAEHERAFALVGHYPPKRIEVQS